MPKELDIRALTGSKMRAEMIAIAEAEGVDVTGLDTKRKLAVAILGAREARAEAAEEIWAEATGDYPAPKPAETPEAELETDVETVEVAPEAVEVSPEVAEVIEVSIELPGALGEMVAEILEAKDAVEAAPEPETVTVVRQEEGTPTVTEEVKAIIAPEYVEACNTLSVASKAFLAAGAVDGPERKARREAKAKLYALLA